MDGPRDALILWRERPDIFVRQVFGVVPDAWQEEVLRDFPHNQRQAMKACKGPGKTTVLAWIAWNFLLTRPFSKIAATSISGDNLSDGLWPEMAKWQSRSELLSKMFVWTKTRIERAGKDGAEWFMSARSWAKSANKEQQGNTLAGLHADYLMFILDEAGGIPDAIMAAAEAGLASGIESHLVMAGNPTHLEGPLYRACTRERNLWKVYEITSDPDDPKRTPRVSVQWAREQIEKYGRDNPWVLVNVFGRFPPASMNALIGPDEVEAAMKRHYDETAYGWAAKILGIDVALYGDDSSVMFPRQGLVALKPDQFRNVKPIDGAGAVARKWNEWGANACFVDATGGFGETWIVGLEQLNRAPIRIHFSGASSKAMYYNKRTEMWFEMCQWVKDGGALPNVPELVGELCAAAYMFKGDKLLLTDKAQMKVALGRSPDYADALALTFAQPVAPPAAGLPYHMGGQQSRDYTRNYDPLANL